MSQDEIQSNPFLSVDKSGNPVERRVSTPAAMRSIYGYFVQMDEKDARRRKMRQDMYELNVPYDPVRLKKLGLSNIANFNTGDLRGFIDGRVGVITDLSLDTTPLVELRPLPMGQAGPRAEDFAEIIADEFSTTLRDVNKLLPCLATMFKECDLHGLGPVTWPAKDDYHPVALRRGQLRFRTSGPVFSRDHELFEFESTVPLHYFRRIFDNPKLAEQQGWNPAAVRKFLVAVFVSKKDPAARPDDSTSTSAIESITAEMRCGGWMEANQFMDAKVLHGFVKEAKDGKIRHMICVPGEVGVDEFLYDKEAAYDRMDQCVTWMPAAVTEHEAGGVRGIASLVAPIMDMNNRLVCHMYTVGFREGLTYFTAPTPGSSEQATISERGPYAIIPGDLQVPAHAVRTGGSQLQSMASLRELGSNISGNNASGARGSGGSAPERMTSGGDRKTKEEVLSSERMKQAGEKGLFAARTLTLDTIFRESFSRFMKLVAKPVAARKQFPEVQGFIDRCILRGVPKETLKKTDELFTVYTNRILVTGGGNAHAAVLSGLLSSFGGGFDELGRSRAIRDIVRFQLGMKSADRYHPEGNRDSAPSNATSLAAVENDAVLRGGVIVVGYDQYHWTHIPVHMTALGKLVEQYQQAEKNPQALQNPEAMFNSMHALSVHVQEHVQFGATQPGMKEVASQVMKQLQDMAPIMKGLTMMIGTLDRQRKAAARKDAEERAKLEEAARGNDAAVAMHESDNKAKLKEREQDLMHDVRLKKLEQDREIELMKARNESISRIAGQTSMVSQGREALGNPVELPSSGGGAPVPTYDSGAVDEEDSFPGE